MSHHKHALEPADVEREVFIPQYDVFGRRQRRVLIICTGGTLTMAPNPNLGGGLAPVEGMLTKFFAEGLDELKQPHMPETQIQEFAPLLDSSDMGPAEWVRIAETIASHYLHFDGFVVVMGTDTMAYVSSALSFMLENLGKPVILTGSQIPLCQPQTDARRNLIMAIIFASRDTISRWQSSFTTE
jgi:L-asparaginase